MVRLPDEDAVLAWFREFRRQLGHPASRSDVLAGHLLDVLGALLQERDALVGALEAALADRDAAMRRAEALERELDSLRATAAEPAPEAKRSWRLGIATVVVGLLTGVGGYAAGTVQADATVEAARIAQETALTQTVVAEAAKGRDIETLIDLTRKAAEALRDACD